MGFVPNMYGYECVPFGFKAELEQILDFLNYKENPNLTDYFGTTLLHFAVTDNYDNYEIVEKLIKAGADVNARNNCKQTPLHLAVFRYNWRVIDTLIAFDADINIREIKGNTALHFAINLLWSKRSRYQQERSLIVKKLLDSGANPNIPNTNGETALMLAVKYGNVNVVKDLLAFGANVHSRNQYSETCLHLLSWCPQPELPIFKELVRHGACVNCCDVIGRTPLDVLLENEGFGYGYDNAEFLIKIATLVHWKHKITFQTSQNRELAKMLMEFEDECYEEVSRMKTYVYSDKSNLCCFAVNGGKDTKKNETSNIFSEVLDTLLKDNFPIYNDLIESHFDKSYLQEKLFKMNIYARSGKDKVNLHSFVIYEIASYLTSRDLLNLVRAYSNHYN